MSFDAFFPFILALAYVYILIIQVISMRYVFPPRNLKVFNFLIPAKFQTQKFFLANSNTLRILNRTPVIGDGSYGHCSKFKLFKSICRSQRKPLEAYCSESQSNSKVRTEKALDLRALNYLVSRFFARSFLD